MKNNLKIILLLLIIMAVCGIKATDQASSEQQPLVADIPVIGKPQDPQNSDQPKTSSIDIKSEEKKENLIQELNEKKEINKEKDKESNKEKDKEQKNKNELDAKNEEKKDIYLNFDNTELSNFINYMSELKKINLIPDKTLQGVKVSLTIREALTPTQAWNVFLTVLEMSGFSIIQIGDVQVVMPKKQKEKQPLPPFINVSYETLPDSDLNIRYVTILQNINVASIQDLLKSMLSPEGTVIPYPDINGMIIMDKSYNIKSAMKIILELDQTGLQESLVVMPLKRANAKDVKTLIDGLIQKNEPVNPLARLLGKQAESSLEFFSPTTRIIAEERTNSLFLLGNQQSIKKIEDFIVKNIDTELRGTESPLHIFELQNTDAAQIKDILEQVTNTPELEQAGKYGAVRGGVKYFKPMKYQVDKDGNRLIVSSTDKQDWELLRKTIVDLDKPQPQVAIETLIITVNFEDDKALGGALRNKYTGQVGKGVNIQTPTPNGKLITKDGEPNNILGNMIGGLVGGLGSSIMTFGKPDGTNPNIWGIFEAIKTQANTSVLSQPFFTVTNKTPASIKIGSTLNVPSGTTETKFNEYKEVSAFTQVDLTPQINPDGIIRLNIKVTFSEFTDTSIGNKNDKVLSTDVAVADGQVLVLGGFIKTKVTENEQKTPLLGDIPILGWLFKYKKRDISKDYIFIFLSPTIIKPRSLPGSELYTRMKLHDATDYIEGAVQTRTTIDPVHNWFFNPAKENYSHKVVDFANARYQPTTVDIKNDPYYRSSTEKEEQEELLHKKQNTKLDTEREKILLSIKKEEQTTEHEKVEINQKNREDLKKIISNETLLKNETPEINLNKRENLKQMLLNTAKTTNNTEITMPNTNPPQEKPKEVIDFAILNNKMKRRQMQESINPEGVA